LAVVFLFIVLVNHKQALLSILYWAFLYPSSPVANTLSSKNLPVVPLPLQPPDIFLSPQSSTPIQKPCTPLGPPCLLGPMGIPASVEETALDQMKKKNEEEDKKITILQVLSCLEGVT